MQPATQPVERTLLAVTQDLSGGVGYVRFEQPFEHLRSSGYRLRTLGTSLDLVRTAEGYGIAPRLLQDTSAVIFPQLVHSPTLPDGGRIDLVGSICDVARDLGLPILYSTDDYLPAIDESNPMYGRVVGSLENLLVVLERADAFLVTTQPLAARLAPLGKPVHVVPNAIDPRRWSPRPRTSAELRIGWHGSNSHLEDLLLVLPAIRELQRLRPVRFFIYGLVPDTLERELGRVRNARHELQGAARRLADTFCALVDELGTIDHVHIPFSSMDGFFATLPRMDLDIGLCPLRDTEFNSYRSALKFYEYAAVDTLTVASDVVAYADEVSIRVPDDPAAWTETIERLLADPADRDQQLREQQSFVRRERTIDRLRERWAAALADALGPSAATPRAAGQ